WMTVTESLLGLIQESQYVRKPTAQEQSLFSGERSRYLVVYPFTKSTDWYLLGRDARQGVMNEHMRIGHDYPQVRQLLANSFGLDDMDFLVAYETDDLATFSQLVRDLRGSASRPVDRGPRPPRGGRCGPRCPRGRGTVRSHHGGRDPPGPDDPPPHALDRATALLHLRHRGGDERRAGRQGGDRQTAPGQVRQRL